MFQWFRKMLGGSEERGRSTPHSHEITPYNPVRELPPVRRAVHASEDSSSSTRIPPKFRHLPEAKCLMQAEAEFEEALEQENQLAQGKSGQVHVISDHFQRAGAELDAARAAYDVVTGEQTTPLPLSPESMSAFQQAAEEYFGKAALEVNSTLERISPALYGFATPFAIVTIGVYHGHSPSVCVKLREREPGEALGVCDGRDIGLGNVVAYLNPAITPEPLYRTLDAEMMGLALDLGSYGRPFLLDPSADWIGLREWLSRKIEKSLAEMPWLDKFRKNV